MKQEERTRRTVSRILDAAIKEFGENGYAGGTVNRICESGINKGLVYHNFKDKDTLYLACLKQSCDRMVDYIRKEDGEAGLLPYMNARGRFLCEFPNEAHILFEALFEPPSHLQVPVRETFGELDGINDRVYRRTLAGLKLRDGVTEEDALRYFHRMQQIFNSEYSGPAWKGMTCSERIKAHETELPRLLDLMLYGIAKGDDQT